MLNDKLLLPKNPENTKTPWLWIGTWSMGGEGFGRHDERESLKVLNTAAEKNIRHFDTAGFYAHGMSERLLQKIIKTERQEFFLSSKGGLAWNGRNVEHRGSPEELKDQLSASLDRLKTDYLDLYQLHWPDPETPLIDSISALKEFQAQGLIRFWGVGNLSEQQVKNIFSNDRNIPHQVHFNPVHRSDALLQAGKDSCIHCIISPLEQGLLGNGKSSYGMQGIGKKDFRKNNPHFSDQKVLRWNMSFNYLVKQHSLSKVTLVLMWICSRPHVHAVIPGPRRVDQLNELLAFKTDVEKHGLIEAEGKVPILSEEKVQKAVPEEIWHHLCQGPE